MLSKRELLLFTGLNVIKNNFTNGFQVRYLHWSERLADVLLLTVATLSFIAVFYSAGYIHPAKKISSGKCLFLKGRCLESSSDLRLHIVKNKSRLIS